MSTDIPDEEGPSEQKPGRTGKPGLSHIGVKVHPTDPTHLYFFSHDKQSPTATQREVVRQYEATASQLRILLLPAGLRAEFNELFALLLTSAQGAFSKPGVQSELARDDIKRLQQEVASRVGLRLRDSYIRRFLFWTVGLTSLGLVIGFAAQYVADEVRQEEEHRFVPFAFAMFGACWGICLGNVVQNLRAPSLNSLVNNLFLAPHIRLFVFGGFIAAFILLFHYRIVLAGFGPFTTAQILENSGIAFLMGFGLGLLHLVIPAKFEEKARLLLGYDKSPE